jgi:serine/threonine protein kinase/Tfp pilus assembly protein PilF
MSSSAEPFTTLPLRDAEHLDSVCDAFEAAWRESTAQLPRLDDFVSPLPAKLQPAALLELLPIEIAYLQRRGAAISVEDYLRRFPIAEPYLQEWLHPLEQSTPLRQLSPGERFDKYTIVGWLGAGGMGDVYRAHDTELGREVAIKILLRPIQCSSEALARIQVEARALAALSHPHIVTVHDFDTHNGLAYMALELLAGQTLAERLKRGPLPPQEALSLAIQLAKGLSAAHEKQIVHRDLKPQNIFLAEGGQAKILDFGLARLAQRPAESPANATPNADTAVAGQTAAGTRLGTTGYMAPEQIRGEVADCRSDIFALGCVLHEMLTGSAPFRRATRVETDAAILNELPQAQAGLRDPIAHALGAVCRRCLEKSPAQRYQSAALLSEELVGIESSRAQKKGRLFRRAEHALLAAACALLAALGVWLWKQNEAIVNQNEENLKLDKRIDELLEEIELLSFDQLHEIKPRVRELNRLGERRRNGRELMRLAIAGAVKPDADYCCVMGYLSLERGTHADIQDAIGWFKQADSRGQHVPALAGLGECHYALSNAYASPRDEMPRVQDYAQQAVALGDKSGAAEVLLGLFEHRFNWNWTAARQHFENALRMQPKSAIALHTFGNALAVRGEFAAGIARLEDALRQDPDSLEVQTDLALAWLYSGDDRRAEQVLREVLAKDRGFFPAQWALGEVFLQRKEYAAAIVELERACKLDPQSVEAQAELAFCLGKSGTRANIARAKEIVKQFSQGAPGKYVPPTALAVAQLGLNPQAPALASLSRGEQERDEWLVWIQVDPVFDELRGQPEFERIVAKVTASPSP